MISVALTTFNGENFIQQQIESILNQSMNVDEIVVCDDGSSDDTVKILKKYPVRLFQNEQNLGYQLNFKKAISLCSGDYIFLCDQDDIWEPQKVEQMINQMKIHPNIHVLASSFQYIDSNNQPISIKKGRNTSNNGLYPKRVKDGAVVEVTFDEYLSRNYFQGCSLLIDSWIKTIVLENFSTRIPHDWLFSMVASSYHGMFFYNEILFKYRLHDNNTIGVDYYTQSNKKHFKNAQDLELRLKNAENVICVIEIIQRVNPKFYSSRQIDFEQIVIFAKNHNEYLKNRDFFHLFMQNKSPYYSLIKTNKARVMDLLFCITSK